MIGKIKSFEAYMGGIIAVMAVLVMLFGPAVSPNDPMEIHFASEALGPSHEFPLGVDNLGRCELSRILHGARYTIGVAVIALTITIFIAVFYGFVSGYFGGGVDLLMTGLCDIAMAFPPLVIIFSLIGIFDVCLGTLLFSVVIASWPWNAKIIRSQVLIQKNRDYIMAARICGTSHLKIITKHIFPNVLNTIIVMYFTGVSGMILMISGFSYLGIGFDHDLPEWGVMLCEAKAYIYTRPELLLIPGACIFLTSIAFNLIGESLRDGSK